MIRLDKEHSGTAVLMSMIRVKRGMAIRAEPKPDTPWTQPARNKIKPIRIKVVI